MILAKQLSDTEILLDFGLPIQSTGVVASQFNVPGYTVQSLIVQTNNLKLILSTPIDVVDELWVIYTAFSSGAQLFSIIPQGQASQVKSFEVLVASYGASEANPQVYNLPSTEFTPTLGDFIDAFTLEEAIKITNPANSAAVSPNELKFLRAVEDAEALWNSELINATAASMLVLSPGKRRSLLTIARYLLDAHCPRPFVVEAYKEVIRNLKATSGEVANIEDQFTGIDDFFYFANQNRCGPQSCCNTGLAPSSMYII
jgi:hypothetical protein